MIVTPIYAGLLALWFLVLSIRVIQYRGSAKINLGDGGDAEMLRRIRAHANFAEYVPLILLMIGFLELRHTSIYILHAMGATLLVARLLHGYALAFTEQWFAGRFVGTLLTFILLGTGGLTCVVVGVHGAMVLAQ
ncbi:MAG: MAPEG family protein [Nevskia sp.]|nr:MAPEG family protein [Nevskia sp.]